MNDYNNIMKIAVVTGHATLDELESITIPNKKDYCNTNGYRLLSYGSSYNWDTSRGFGWMKIPLFIELLKNKDLNDIDWFFWIDTDACFMNFNKKLENFIDDWAFYIVGRDCNGINIGTSFFKNSRKTLEFFKDVWETGPIDGTNWWNNENEQAVIDFFMLSDKYRKGVSVVSNKLFNAYLHDCNPGVQAYGKYSPGDLVLHLGGNWDPAKEVVFEKYILPYANTDVDLVKMLVLKY